MKDLIYNMLSDIYPMGARFSPTNTEEHKAIKELEAEDKIRKELFLDEENLDSFYLYYWKS